ncbi:hypothetical protein PanWU01x14_149330 [Parasponia andersonii]|uniref:Uncharacterized protein n=1 Tax=Parasponia andersonii TaxID=3476 RepID=A0A2P5CJ02_PARAD|nr:hypothetical protein PanWU01x14_149330 [Parasponia andersonii]
MWWSWRLNFIQCIKFMARLINWHPRTTPGFDSNVYLDSNAFTSSQAQGPAHNSSAFIASPTSVNELSWDIDSGATDHMIADLNNLNIQADYKGKEKNIVGNGTLIPISHIGQALLSHGTC